MRYIKFRTLPKHGTKKVELVRVSENGKIVPKGYGALNLQVLDQNIADQGSLVTQPDILCFGATETIDEITINGKVDIYIDDMTTPLLANVDESEILQLGAEGLKGLLTPYEIEPVIPTSEWGLLLPAPARSNETFEQGTGLIVGVKFTDSDEVVYRSTLEASEHATEGYYRIFGYNRNQGNMFRVDLRDWLKSVFSIDVTVEADFKTKYIPVDTTKVGEDFYHASYAKKILKNLLRSNVGGLAWFDGEYQLSLRVLDLKFQLPSNVEYLVIPALPTPYGSSSYNRNYNEIVLNNLLQKENVVYYQDGRVEYGVADIPSMIRDDLTAYPPVSVPLYSYPDWSNDVYRTFDIADVPMTMDYVSQTPGRYVEVDVPEGLTYMYIRYTSTEQRQIYGGAGHYVLNTVLNAFDYSIWDNVMINNGANDFWWTSYDALTEVDENPHVVKFFYPIGGKPHRIKFPEDVTSFELAFA